MKVMIRCCTFSLHLLALAVSCLAIPTRLFLFWMLRLRKAFNSSNSILNFSFSAKIITFFKEYYAIVFMFIFVAHKSWMAKWILPHLKGPCHWSFYIFIYQRYHLFKHCTQGEKFIAALLQQWNSWLSWNCQSKGIPETGNILL